MIAYLFKRKGKYSAKVRMDWEPRVAVIALKTTDKRVAQGELDRITREKFQEHHGLIAPQTVRDAAKMPLRELADEFLADVETSLSPGTFAKYGSNLRTLLAGTGWTQFADVSANSFCRWRSGSDLAPGTLNDIRSAAVVCFDWLRKQKLAGKNPLEDVDKVRETRNERFRRALSEDEQRRLLASAPPERALIYFLVLETGIRRKELGDVRVTDFVMDTPKPFLRLPSSITKNRKTAHMVLRPLLARLLTSYLQHAGLFAHCEGGSETRVFPFRHRVPRVWTIARDLLKAGIEFENGDGRVDLHSLRVSFCVNLLRAGESPRIVQELMRHSDIKLTMQLYTDVSQLPIAAAVHRLPTLWEEQVPTAPEAPATSPASESDAKQGRGPVGVSA